MRRFEDSIVLIAKKTWNSYMLCLENLMKPEKQLDFM